MWEDKDRASNLEYKDSMYMDGERVDSIYVTLPVHCERTIHSPREEKVNLYPWYLEKIYTHLQWCYKIPPPS